jgi:hypothetical protein
VNLVPAVVVNIGEDEVQDFEFNACGLFLLISG